MTERKKFTVKRSQWLRGGKSPDKRFWNDPMLLNRDGNRCCLGFAGEQLCGLSNEQLLDISGPRDPHVRYEFNQGMPGLFREAPTGLVQNAQVSTYTRLLMAENDMDKDDATREENLKKLFNEINIDVEFVD